MATRTLKARSAALVRFSVTKRAKEVHHQFATEDSAPEPVTASTPAPVVQAPVAIAPISTAAVASIEDAPVKSVEIPTAIIAKKLKKPANEVPLSNPIKNLVGGESTL